MHHFIGNYPDNLAHRSVIRMALINSGNVNFVEERQAKDARGNPIPGMYALWGNDEFKRKKFHRSTEGQQTFIVCNDFSAVV